MIPKYTATEYQSWLMQSRDRFLLVEGRDDKHLFEVLLHEFFAQTDTTVTKSPRPVVDSAEDIIEAGITSLGNREVVEYICAQVEGTAYAERMVGFVDRELREFERDPELQDRLKRHNIIGRCVWSRGHSIENYLFDFDALRSPFRGCSMGINCATALELFEKAFESSIRLACTASLAAYDVNQESGLRLSAVKGSMSWEVIGVSASGAVLNRSLWRRKLISQGLTSELADRLVERFDFWDPKVQTADFAVARWMCHGHVGFSCIWGVYARCVYETSATSTDAERTRITRNMLRVGETYRFGLVVEDWVRRALGNQGEYPIEVLSLLGLSLPESRTAA